MAKSDVSPLETVPARPRILPCLPVLRRTASSVQCGLDPRHAVIIDQLSPELFTVIDRMDGSHTLEELCQLADPTDVRELVTLLAGAGLLDSALGSGAFGRLATDRATWALRTEASSEHVIAPRERATGVVYGDGRLASGIVALLAAAGIGQLIPVTAGQVGAADLGIGYCEEDLGTPRSTAMRLLIERTASGTRWFTSAGQITADFAVIAGAESVDPTVFAELMAHNTAHLMAVVREGVGIVGPLVQPGRSPCLQCVALARAEQDSTWPYLAAQLATSVPAAELSTAYATAGLAVHHIMRYLCWSEYKDQPPPLWGAIIELDFFAGTLRRTTLSTHPDCPCGAP